MVVALAIIRPLQSWGVIVLVIAVALMLQPTALHRAERVLAINGATSAFLVFALWAVASSRWAPDPGSALQVSLILLTVVLFTHLACRLAAELDQQSIRAIGLGVVAALLVTGMVLAIECSTSQALGRGLLNTFKFLRGQGDHMIVRDGEVVQIGDIIINRRVCVWMLWFWPATAFALKVTHGNRRTLLVAALLLLAAAIAVTTRHASSVLAFLASALVMAAWQLSERKVLWGVGLGWCAAVLLVVPLATITYDAGLSQNPRLFHSARERVAFWGYTAHHVSEHPIVGHGANAAQVINAIIEKGDRPKDTYVATRPGFHTHNFYLQIWYELGAVGALAFLAMGLAALSIAWRYGQAGRSLVFAELVAIAAMIATNYGLWQFWFQTAMAGGIILIAIWLRLDVQAEGEEAAGA